jgi:hypothetical protein
VVAGLAACSSSPDPEPDAEALTGPTHFRRICVSSLHASRWTIAVATGTNDSDRPVTLVDAALTDVEGLDLVRTDVIRPRWAVDTFGVWNGSPPRGVDDDPVSRRLWRSREPVGDLRVEPGERVNFVLHLRGDAGGSAGPLEVTYRTDAGREHTYATNVEYVVERDCTD